MKFLRVSVGAIVDAFVHFHADDGWAIASHIALSTLMAMFPFLIVVTSLAGFIGSTNLADEVARLVVAAWPKEVANPIAKEIHNVLTTARGGVLTVGAFFALYFASSGVESLRIGLNRAYELKEKRSFWLLRLESIGYVLVAAIGLLALAFLVVLGPLVFKGAVRYAPWLDVLEPHFDIVRFVGGGLVIALSLFILHMLLPAGHRRIRDVSPGIAATLVLWLVAGYVFGRYLSDFSYAYVTYYAGLASVMTALIFLYFSACLFIYGGELNAAILRVRGRAKATPEALHGDVPTRGAEPI